MPGLPARLLVLVAALAACAERDPLDSDTVTDATGMSQGTGASSDDGTAAPPSTTDEPPTGSLPGDPTTTPDPPSLGHDAHIQPLWDAHCVAGCHTPGGTAHAWFALSDDAFASIVERPALELPAMMRVAPGDLDGSYLWHKVNGTHIEVGGSGVSMPPAGALSIDDLDTIAQWILQGCPP